MSNVFEIVGTFVYWRREIGIGAWAMADEFWIALLIVAAVAAYVISKVAFYMRKSDEQWQQVDKSKLKTWDDDED